MPPSSGAFSIKNDGEGEKEKESDREVKKGRKINFVRSFDGNIQLRGRVAFAGIPVRRNAIRPRRRRRHEHNRVGVRTFSLTELYFLARRHPRGNFSPRFACSIVTINSRTRGRPLSGLPTTPHNLPGAPLRFRGPRDLPVLCT